MSDFQLFLPIAKLNEKKRTVSGYASTPAVDADGEVVTLDAVKKALPDYMQWGNVREMHKLSAVGVAQEANVDPQGLFLTAYISDDVAWKKCLDRVYKGFSIGGRKLAKVGNKITELDLNEISIVDRPANPECRFDVAKRAKDEAPAHLIKIKRTPEEKAERVLAKMAKIVGDLSKAGPPAARDGFSLPARNPRDVVKDPETHGIPNAKPDGVPSVNDAKPTHNVTRKTEDDADAPKTDKGGDKPGDGSKPYGDVTYADPGYRKDGKSRYPIETEDHIRAAWNYISKPKNAKKYKPEHHAKVKASIVAAWKAKIHKDGPPGAKAPAAAAAKVEKPTTFLVPELQGSDDLEGLLTLRKGKKLAKSMSIAGSLAYVFDSVRGAQRSLLLEGKREGNDKKDKVLAQRLGSIAKDIAGVISQKAEHEGGEAMDLTDADDGYLHNILGEGNTMTDGTFARAAGGDSSGDPLGQALLDMVKRAAMPSKAKRMDMAEDCVKKARRAAKDAREAIEEAHKMHKAAYLSKAAAKAKSKGDDDDDADFDHTGAMEKLQKAYGDIDKARTFAKAAMAQIRKARSGQRGQEAGDSDEPFYTVPPATVKDMTPEQMNRTGPGSGQGSMSSMYPDDGGVYSGKAADNVDLRKYMDKDGRISANVVGLIMQKAQSDGQLAALRNLPVSAAGGGARPFAFDTTRVLAGVAGSDPRQAQSVNKAIFDGVDVGAIGSGDEHAHTAASARVMGNYLLQPSLGKSIMDPSFKGMTGTK